ncbi:hypothetical protein D050_4819A, partial [Vibrio parahaemolyticus VPCR-2009]
MSVSRTVKVATTVS